MDRSIFQYLCKNIGEVMDKVVECRGAPAYIRCDNDPEFISKRLKKWAFDYQVELKFIRPGKLPT